MTRRYIHRNLRETITYWAPTTPTTSNQLNYAAPVRFPARWQDEKDLEILIGGKTLRCNAKVFLDRDVLADGRLFRGSSSATDPKTVDSYVILRITKIPTLQGDDYERTAIV